MTLRRLEEYVWASARQFPNHIALEIPQGSCPDKSLRLSYHQLMLRVRAGRDRLNTLVSVGVDQSLKHREQDPIVMMALNRSSLEAYLSILTILDMGAAYCAIDRSFPDQRALHMIEDASPLALLTSSDQVEHWTSLLNASSFSPVPMVINVENLFNDHEAHDMELSEDKNNNNPLTSSQASSQQAHLSTRCGFTFNKSLSQLAYLIYTSGSTGRPKGVMIEHGQIAHLIADDLRVFDLGKIDRVLQGSSHAYDSSVEEMFMAWSAGATLVCGSDEVLRLGPDLAHWLATYQITVLAPPPTLLRTMGHEASAQLTQLRLLYVGGEALPLDIAHTWAKKRVLVNGYGPTECSVTATRAWITEDVREISIGRPHPGLRAMVVDDSLNEVATGEMGELLLYGPALARGYLGQPELTAARFITHTVCGRSYRTGDLVALNAQGEFLFHGRADDQVKLRGYRLELTEVERHLAAYPDILEAACTVIGEAPKQRLVALITTRSLDVTINRDHLIETLSQTLPHYMIPSVIASAESLPRLTSGKLDRRSVAQYAAFSSDHDAHDTPCENQDLLLNELSQVKTLSHDNQKLVLHLLCRLIASLLDLAPDQIKADDDFFARGGDSITAASLISFLRQSQCLSTLAVRDVYLLRIPRALVQKSIEHQRDTSETDVREQPHSRYRVSSEHVSQTQLIITTICQALSILFGLGLGLIALSLGSLVVLPWVLRFDYLEWLVLAFWALAPLLWIVRLPIGLALTLLAKRILIGRYQVGQAPIWGTRYLRQWWMRNFARLLPWEHLQGSPLYSWVLRCLGAEVGQGVYFHRGVDFSQGGWDLITIEDHVTVGRDVSIRAIEYEQLTMYWDKVKIGAHASLDIRSGVSAGAEVGQGSILSAHSSVSSGEIVPPMKHWSGARGEEVDPLTSTSLPSQSHQKPQGKIKYAIRFHLAHAITTWLLSLPWMIGLYFVIIMFMDHPHFRHHVVFSPDQLLPSLWIWVVTLIVVSAVSLALWLTYVGVLCRFRGTIPCGQYSVHSREMIIFWQKERLLAIASRWLSGSLFWPTWLRIAGAQVGPDSEISTIMEVVPEHLNIKGECFSADGVYLGAPKIRDGSISFAKTTLDNKVFIGNHAVIPAGVSMGSEALVGISACLEQSVPPDTAWFGNPLFELPRREVVSVDSRLTHRPSRIRYLSRLCWELGRGGILFLAWCEMIVWFSLIPDPVLVSDFTLESLLSSFKSASLSDHLFVIGLGASLLAVHLLFIWTLKWLLIGRMREGQHPLWSCWCSRWDTVYVYWGAFARPLLSLFEGTLWLNMILRSFGLQIGKRVFLGPGFAQVVDPDMLRFEDEVTVMNLFQAHSFEDRVLKLAPVLFKTGSSVGTQTVVLYGSEIGRHTIVMEHSVVMKREVLRAGLCYGGAPTSQQR